MARPRTSSHPARWRWATSFQWTVDTTIKCLESRRPVRQSPFYGLGNLVKVLRTHRGKSFFDRRLQHHLGLHGHTVVAHRLGDRVQQREPVTRAGVRAVHRHCDGGQDALLRCGRVTLHGALPQVRPAACRQRVERIRRQRSGRRGSAAGTRRDAAPCCSPGRWPLSGCAARCHSACLPLPRFRAARHGGGAIPPEHAPTSHKQKRSSPNARQISLTGQCIFA